MTCIGTKPNDRDENLSLFCDIDDSSMRNQAINILMLTATQLLEKLEKSACK